MRWGARRHAAQGAATRQAPDRQRLALFLSLLVVGGVAMRAAAAAGPPPMGPAASVVVAACPSSGVRVPADYLGLSIEWGMVQRWFGTNAHRTVQPMVALLRSLQATPATPGVLRIGGNSEDGYSWDPGGTTAANTTFAGTIDTGMMDAVLGVARASGWKVVIGLNLRANRPANAASLARYVTAHDVGRSVLAFELGNEPDAYFGADIPGYMARVGTYVNALDADPSTRGAPIAGPALSNEADAGYVSAFAQAFGRRMPFATWHHYANRPTLTQLLDESVSQEWSDRITQVAAAAIGVRSRMAEGNSVGNGGLNHVSNVMGSTAWLVDTLLTGAAAGLGGYNLHSWDAGPAAPRRLAAFYTPFVIRHGQVQARPSFFGLALLRNMPGSRFCQTVTTATQPAGIKAWGLSDSDSTHLYVYVVNKTSTAGAASVLPPADFVGAASVSRIDDAGGCGGQHTSINGAGVPGSGRFTWNASPAPAPASGAYQVELGPCQAALVDVSRQ